MLESHKTKGHLVLVLCNMDSLSMKLDHGATAEQLVVMGYKLFTDQGSCVQATMALSDIKPPDHVTAGEDKGKGKQTWRSFSIFVSPCSRCPLRRKVCQRR